MKKIAIMKFNKIALFAATVLSISGASCGDNYLDKEVDLTIDAETVFSDYDRTRGFQARLYDYLPDAFAGFNDSQFRGSNECMTDNALSDWGVHYYHTFMQDGYDATNHWFANFYWPRDYKGIRQCNIYIANARPSVVGNAEKSGDDNRLHDRWIAEIRILRAILHFDLATRFGDVPIVGDDEGGTPIILEPSSPLPPRTPAADVLRWVIKECDNYKNDLPFRYANETENWGRINGAAAYALKSRAALYLASPLYNKDGDKKLWADAATAATDFITLNARQSNPYRLHTTPDNDINENYYDCFVTNPVMNNEYILSRSVWTTLAIEEQMSPCGFQSVRKSSGRINPTQNLVDSYETIDGLPIDKDSNYDPQNPYVNRDPRLEQTILHQGSIWGIGAEAREIDMNGNADAEGGIGVDYTHANGGTATGYYSKKYVNNIPWDGTVTGARHACPIFRYAEILLNAAEALNESDNTPEAIKYVDQVRERVGMPSYTGKSQTELRERIRNERRIELCFEDHRYFDTRRWKLFDENVSPAAEASKPLYQQVYNLYGVEIRRGTNTLYNYGAPYGTVGYTRQSFSCPKNYFWPIPYTELVKTGYEQTPGWEL